MSRGREANEWPARSVVRPRDPLAEIAQRPFSLPRSIDNIEVNMYTAIKWPEDMTPSRSPIHFTNELCEGAR
jgi:hypothetical protein